MEEWIKKSDAIKAVNRAKAEGMTECPTYYLGTVPSADYLTSVYMVGYNNGYEKGKADRPRGEWIYNGNFCGMNHHKCSVCGRTEFRMSAYCYNCGAQMKGADDE